MASVGSIPDMRARALTVMATRSQDQRLVADIAADLGVKDMEAMWSRERRQGRLIPSFGWHPWFSHQLYDDSATGSAAADIESEDEQKKKKKKKKAAHYEAVLVPAPTDAAFIDALPPPAPLSSFIASTRALLEAHPHALVGEIGLDKVFRLPQQWDLSDAAARDDGLTPGGREGRTLSPHRVRMPHQEAVLTAQLHLAGELGRAVSVHGVQAHGALYDALAKTWKGHEREVVSRRQRRQVAPGAEDTSGDDDDDDDDDGDDGERHKVSRRRRAATKGCMPFPPRICLHSFSGSVEVVKQYLNPSVPAAIFFSFSSAVNLGTESVRAKVADMIRMVPEDRLLVESDLHTAGQVMDDALEDMYREVCRIRGWDLEDGVKKIGRNFDEFIFG
jgi:Tat protein secretion system quality control protein TatD with DNase activity